MEGRVQMEISFSILLIVELKRETCRNEIKSEKSSIHGSNIGSRYQFEA